MCVAMHLHVDTIYVTCTLENLPANLMKLCNYVEGSIEVQIATMSKQDRANTDEVYVCGFIPAYVLPKKMPWSLDPFIHPLITEIEDVFIDGITITYSYSNSYWISIYMNMFHTAS